MNPDVPAASSPPAPLAGAFAIINEGRSRLGKPAFRWDDRLARQAQDLCEWGWRTYQSGGNVNSDPHHDFIERARASGFPLDFDSHPPDAREGIGNWSECGAIAQGGKGPGGWVYPPMSPEDAAKQAVEMLLDGSGQLGQDEGHVRDFRTAWTHVGLGYNQGMFVVEYGFLPDEPPDPEPPDKIELW